MSKASEQKKSIWLFFYGQSFEDGIRTTVAVLLPALLLSYVDQFEAGITISLGAACVSLTDAPGPIVHRKNTMLFCLLFIFLTAIITGYARLNIVVLGVSVVLLTFFFSMFTVYGMRAATVGNAALLAMVLTMDKPIEPALVVQHGFFIFCGGLWYFLISIASYKARPYRPAQRSLGENIREVARFLSLKADFYNIETDLDEDYKKLLAQQVVVIEKQDALRELLFKTRQTVEESTPEGRRLVMTFINMVDLFEDITASYYDYHLLRDRYGNTGILHHIYQLAKKLSGTLDKIGIAIFTNTEYKNKQDFTNELAAIKKQIDEYSANSDGTSNLVLKKMLVNIRRIVQRITDLQLYFSELPKSSKENKAATHVLFVGHQSLDPRLILNNLNFSSVVFKHAMRVGIACLVGYIISKSIAAGYHSYWILMTIIFMLKPSFSLTKQRNIERIAGTLTGGLIGFLLLSLDPSKQALFFIMVILMVATYSLQRVNYLASIVCMTPFILILFSFFGSGFQGLLQERIIDTVIGCVIAFLAGYFLFPDWESGQLKTYFQKMLEANTAYLRKIIDALEGKPINTTEYKLARKDVYINASNLGAAFQRMLSEPKSTHKNKSEVHQFVILNHVLFSNLASIAASIMNKPASQSVKLLRTAKKTLYTLTESLQLLNTDYTMPQTDDTAPQIKEETIQEEDPVLKEQIEFVYKLSDDIKKTTSIIAFE